MSDQKYSIRSKKANKYITIKDNRCILYQKNSSMQQTFEFLIQQNGWAFILDSKNKMYLSLSDNSDQNGAPIVSIKQTEAQQQSKYFEIHSTDSHACDQVVIFTFCGKCLDCCQESTKNGTEIIQWDFHGGDNQKWIVQKI